MYIQNTLGRHWTFPNEHDSQMRQILKSSPILGQQWQHCYSALLHLRVCLSVFIYTSTHTKPKNQTLFHIHNLVSVIFSICIRVYIKVCASIGEHFETKKVLLFLFSLFFFCIYFFSFKIFNAESLCCQVVVSSCFWKFFLLCESFSKKHNNNTYAQHENLLFCS